MGLLEDLTSGKYNIVLFIIVFILFFHQYWGASNIAKSIKQIQCKDNKEPMADVSNDIKEAVKQVYLADVEAIRNLSEIATKINAGTFVFPGNLTVTGTIKSQSLDSLNSKIDSVNSSLNSSISSTNTNLTNNLTNNVSSLQSQINNKLSNNAQVTIEIQPQDGRAFNHTNHKLAKRTYDGLLFTWMNPNDTTSLYNWKLTAV